MVTKYNKIVKNEELFSKFLKFLKKIFPIFLYINLYFSGKYAIIKKIWCRKKLDWFLRVFKKHSDQRI